MNVTVRPPQARDKRSFGQGIQPAIFIVPPDLTVKSRPEASARFSQACGRVSFKALRAWRSAACRCASAPRGLVATDHYYQNRTFGPVPLNLLPGASR